MHVELLDSSKTIRSFNNVIQLRADFTLMDGKPCKAWRLIFNDCRDVILKKSEYSVYLIDTQMAM